MSNSSLGTLAISLDLELYWGMRDIVSVDNYRKNLQGVRQALPAILELFYKYQIHATWAAVGFLYYDDAEQLRNHVPSQLPSYDKLALDPYQYINTLAKESNQQLHFCPDLIELIKQYSGQEIATHTFSHYYCLETGQTQEQFEADLLAAIAIAEKANVRTTSIIFPRNQYNQDYLDTIVECGINCYRGNETNFLNSDGKGKGDRPDQRILRLLDSYLNLTGQNCYSWSDLRSSYPINIPSSRFLRPYSPKVKFLDGLRLRRITSGLEYAAHRGLVYHLWWHPHNFGVNLAENLNFLEKVLQSYQKLNTQGKMQSLTMNEIAQLCTDSQGTNSSKQMSRV
jgi:peptidoglycan/xylan/chitin deacetylase (PgdA/CDA1 family)